MAANSGARPPGRQAASRASRQQPEYLYGSTMLRPLRLAYGLAPVIEVLEANDHPIAPLLAAADIPRFALEEPSFRIRFEQELRFIRLALQALQLPTAGLIIGQRYHLAMFGVLGLAASCAPTMRDLFRSVPSHPSLCWGCIEQSVWRDGDEEYVTFEENAEVGDCAAFFVVRDTTATLTLFRQTLGAELAPTAVRFRHVRPVDVEPYEQFFGCPVTFDDSDNQIRFGRRMWDTPPPQANAMSFRFFDNQCRRLGEVMQAPLNYADIVRTRLRSATPIPSLGEVVGALYLTRRTLQRRLVDEGTSFSVLLTEVRYERALELMRRSGMDNNLIAASLGFEDASAFSRAFKAWTGLAPREFRRRGLTMA